MNLISVYAMVALLCYLFATLAILSRLFHPKGPDQRVTLSLGCIAIVAHTLSITQLLFSHNVVNFNLPIVIALVALIISMTITAMAIKYKVNLLLPVVYGFSGLWQLVILFVPNTAEFPLIADKLILVTHITIALIAYCILVIATLYAFQVSYINSKLKSKNLSGVSHLPPLMQVERQLFMVLAIGTLCLFASELLGFLFLENMFAREKLHKTVLSLAALVIYVVTLWGHYKQGWRGNRVLVLITIGSFLLTLSYFGSRFVKEFLLS